MGSVYARSNTGFYAGVIEITSVTPKTWRQDSEFEAYETVFTLVGSGFGTIPENDYAYRALVGRNPMDYYGSSDGLYRMKIRVLNNNLAEVYYEERHTKLSPFYLGAIGDGMSEPIWVSEPV